MGDMTRNGNLVRIHERGQLTLAISYQTCVFTRLSTGVGVLNRTKYSKTTSKQISRYVLPDLRGEEYIEVEDARQGISADELAALAVGMDE